MKEERKRNTQTGRKRESDNKKKRDTDNKTDRQTDDLPTEGRLNELKTE